MCNATNGVLVVSVCNKEAGHDGFHHCPEEGAWESRYEKLLRLRAKARSNH